MKDIQQPSDQKHRNLRRRNRYFVVVAFIIILVVQLTELLQSSLRVFAITQTSNDADLPVQEKSKAVVSHDPLPRWGDPDGITMDAIVAFFEAWRASPNKNLDFLNPEIDYPIGNIVMVFGLPTLPLKPDAISPGTPADGISPQIWVEVSAGVTKRRIRNRLTPGGRLLLDALQALRTSNSSKWSRLKNVALTSGLPIIINYSDYRKCSHKNLVVNGTNHSVPIFSLCSAFKAETCNHTFPIPTYSTIEYAKKSPKEWDTVFESSEKRYPWNNKTRVVGWRGGSTCFPRPKNCPRYRMVMEASKRPDLFDVKYTPRSRMPFMGDYVPFEDFQNYTAILDIDGNSWSERFGKLLCMNSVVIKVEPEFTDFFIPQLHPWVHYVPTRFDLSDLANVTEYVLAEENAEQMQSIVRHAQAWCRKTFVYGSLVESLLSTLSFYVDQFDKSDPHWEEVWRQKMPGLIQPGLSWTTIR